MSLERARIEALEAEVDELQETVRQLQKKLYQPEWVPPLSFRLTVMEGRILAALMVRQYCSKDDLHLAISDATGPQTEVKIVDVFVCKMRRKLAPFGVAIKTDWGRGYHMPAASKRAVESVEQAEAA